MCRQNTWRRTRRGSGALAALAAALVAMGGACDRSPTAPRSGEVRLGGLFPLTGDRAASGQASRAAMELAVEDVNQQLGANTAGLRFAAVVEDTRFDPDTARARAQALRARGVQLIVGPQSSAEVARVKSFVQANGMLLVSPSSTAGSLAVAGDNVFRFTPSDSLESVAISALMWDDGVRTIVPAWRDDPGNADLAAATGARFRALGGAVVDGVAYAAAAPDFPAALAVLRARVAQAVAQHGAARVAIYLASFDEVVQLFAGAAADPVLASVRWYGSNGDARIASLLGSAEAAAFAIRAGFPNPLFGLDEASRDVWEPLAARIRARTNVDPDAYALATYDAAWVAAKAYLAVGASPAIDALKASFVTTADTHYGATGWTVLNAAGDRAVGNYDFWAVREVAGGPAWTRVAQYQTRTGSLIR